MSMLANLNLARWWPARQPAAGAPTRHYGVFRLLIQPGLLLMRGLRLQQKAGLLLALLGLPLLMLASVLAFNQWRELREAEGRRVVIDTATALQALATATAARVAGLHDSPALRPALATAQAEVDKLTAEGHPVPPELRADLATLHGLPTLRGTDTAPGDADLLNPVVARLHRWSDGYIARFPIPRGSNTQDTRPLSLALRELPWLQSSLVTLHAALHQAPADSDEHQQLMAAGQVLQQLARAQWLMDSLKEGPLSGIAPPPLPRMAALAAALPKLGAGARSAEVDTLVAPAVVEIHNALLALNDQMHARMDTALAQAVNRTRWQLAIVVLMLLLAAYTATAYVMHMHASMGALQRQMKRLAAGDFATRARAQGRDEVADALRTLNGGFEQIRDLLASVQQSAGTIQHASGQLAAGNNDLSARTERTTNGLNEVVQGVARYAQQLEACGSQVEAVADTVQTLRLDAARNRKQMARLQQRMNDLRGQSRQIGDIVRLIDGIAFRTNILALNASIEASKAGDAGRGFAVVAQEVRALAQRSADSATRINEIVARSTEDIELGAALADETGQVLEASDAHVDRIHGAISDVARLTRGGEQESATILDEVRKLTGDTESNTALVGQLADAGRNLQRQGDLLMSRVNLFKLS